MDVEKKANEVASQAAPPVKLAPDLRELGDNLKGYAPLPQKGQTLSSFEAEELSKHSITWNTFTGTEYYKGRIEIFAPLLEKQSAPEVSEHKTEKTVPAPKAGEDKEDYARRVYGMSWGQFVQTKDFEDNKTAFLSLVTEDVGDVKLQTEPVVIITEAKTVVVDEAMSRGEGASLALLAPPKPILRESLVSMAKISSSTRRFNHRLEYGVKYVPGTDPKSASLSFLNFLLELLPKFEGIVVGIKNLYLPEDRVMKTEESKSGFQMRQYIGSEVHADQAGPLLEEFRRLPAPMNVLKKDLYERGVHYFGLDAEFMLMQALQSIESGKLYEVLNWHSFNRLWDSHEMRLKELDPTIIYQKRRIWRDYSFMNYRVLMDHDQAFVEHISKIVRGHINSVFRVSKREDAKELGEIFKTIRLNKNTLDKATGIADELVRADGDVSIRELALLMQMPRWLEGDISLSLSSASVPVIIGLLMIKVMTPRYVWSDRAVLLMHNYLAKFLVTSLPSYKGPTDTDQFDYQEDRLAYVLNEGSFWSTASDQRTLKSFLLSWSDKDTPARFPLLSINDEAVHLEDQNSSGNVVEFWPHDFITNSSTDKAYTSKRQGSLQDTQQIRDFLRFAGYIEKQAKKRNAWRLISDELIQPLSRLITEIALKASALRDLLYGFNLAHRYMSLHTLTGYERDEDITRVVSHIFDPNSFGNIMFTIDPESLENVQIDNSMYLKSISVHQHMSDVGDGLIIARKYLSTKYWQKSEILEQAMRFVAPHPLKEWIGRELIARKKVLPFDMFRGRTYMSKKLAVVEDFFKRMDPKLLGYTNSFIFTNWNAENTVSMASTDKYRKLLIARPIGNVTSLNITQLETLILHDGLEKFLRSQKTPIRFNIPAKLESGPPSETPRVPFTFGANGKIDVSSIYVGFRDGDEEIRYHTDEYASLLPIPYVSEQPPWMDVSFDYPMRHMIHRLVIWSELEFDIPLEYMRTRPGY
jgi:hypothetical protein